MSARKRAKYLPDYENINTNALQGLIAYFGIQNEYMLLQEQIGKVEAINKTTHSRESML